MYDGLYQAICSVEARDDDSACWNKQPDILEGTKYHQILSIESSIWQSV